MKSFLFIINNNRNIYYDTETHDERVKEVNIE